VLQYIGTRADGSDSQEVDRVAALCARLDLLERKISSLTSYNEQLEEALRKMQVGFRRHRSEVIAPEQLSMALMMAAPIATDPQQPRPLPCHGEAQPTSVCDPASEPDIEDAQPCRGCGDSCSPPQPKSKKRTPHGRRTIRVLPQVVVDILPPEVILGGLAAFEQIGAEECSSVGYRRGGPFELVLRRPKFVPRQSKAAADAIATDGGSAAAAPTSSAATESVNAIEVLEHEVLTVPADPSFRNNPFVDGAIVRFFPETTQAADSDVAVLIAPPPPRPIDKGIADPSLLAHLFVDKHDRHMPYYRQEAELERFGWPIPRSNMARWQHECGKLFRPLVDRMWEQALARSWFAMDATGTAIRGSPEYVRGHIFVLVAEAESVLFRYTSEYDSKTVEELFGGHAATILADASANHNVLFAQGDNREAACWAHARRRFVAAFRAGEGVESAHALHTIQALFRIERGLVGLAPAARLEVRQQKSAPIVENLLELAATRREQLPDDSLTRKGFVYLDNQRGPLREFLSNGEIPIHNNCCERELRRTVKGRVNWLFHGSEDHARSAAAILSLVASAELHGLDPELYLQELLTVLPLYPMRQVLDLAPCNWVQTRQRLIHEGRLKYIDLAKLTGSRLTFRPS